MVLLPPFLEHPHQTRHFKSLTKFWWNFRKPPLHQALHPFTKINYVRIHLQIWLQISSRHLFFNNFFFLSRFSPFFLSASFLSFSCSVSFSEDFCFSFFSLFWETPWDPRRERSRLRERERSWEGETGSESETGRRPPEVRFPVVVARETDGGEDPEPEPVSRNPTLQRPRPDFRRAEARLPVDRRPELISGDSGRKSGDFQRRFQVSKECDFPVIFP
jgi:hypothetical protein